MTDGGAAVAALVAICLAVALVVLVARGRMRAVERAGFVLREAVPEEVLAAAAALVESRVSFAYAKPSAEERPERPPAWLLDLEGYGTDDPRIYLLLYPLSQEPEGQAMLAPRGSRLVPDLIRRHEAGLWARLEPAGRNLQESLAGTDWFLYVDPDEPAPPARLDGLARAARLELPGSLRGIAVSRGFLGVWASGRLTPLLAAGPQVRGVFEGAEAPSDGRLT